MNLTWAGWYFSASHFDEVRQQLHGHDYEVMVAWPAHPPRDAMDLQDLVKGVVCGLDHTTLPPAMSRAEDIARAFLGLLTDSVACEVSRPSQRLKVTVWA